MESVRITFNVDVFNSTPVVVRVDKSLAHRRKASGWGCGSVRRILAYVFLRPETCFWRYEPGS